MYAASGNATGKQPVVEVCAHQAVMRTDFALFSSIVTMNMWPESLEYYGFALAVPRF